MLPLRVFEENCIGFKPNPYRNRRKAVSWLDGRLALFAPVFGVFDALVVARGAAPVAIVASNTCGSELVVALTA